MGATLLTDLVGERQMPKPVRMSKPDESRAKFIVECIYKGIERGWDYGRIAERLNEIGTKSLKNCSWNYLSVQQVVTVINTGKSSWYRWAYELLQKEGKLPAQERQAA